MKKHGLSFKFTLMFTGFTIIALLVTSILSYVNQNQIYKNQREKSIQYVAAYLEDIILADGENFRSYQKYFMKNYSNMLVPHDFTADDIPLAKAKYDYLFSQNYP
nr:hypothetical protein [Treponema sp.]